MIPNQSTFEHLCFFSVLMLSYIKSLSCVFLYKNEKFAENYSTNSYFDWIVFKLGGRLYDFGGKCLEFVYSFIWDLFFTIFYNSFITLKERCLFIING